MVSPRGGPGHDRSPAEGDTQHRLWDMDDAFGKWVEAGQEDGDGTQEDRQAGRGTARAFRPAREKSRQISSACVTLSSPDASGRTRVRVTCRSNDRSAKSFMHDPRAAHHKGPGDKDGEQAKRRHASSSQDQGPQSREHEQPGPCLILEPNKSADSRPGEPRRRWLIPVSGKRLSHAGELNRGVWGCQRRAFRYTVCWSLVGRGNAEGQALRHKQIEIHCSQPRARASSCARSDVFLYKNDCASHRFTTTFLPISCSLMGCCGAVRCDVDRLLALLESRRRDYIGYYLPLTVHLRSDPSIAGAQLTYQDACGQSAIFADHRSTAGNAQAENRPRL